MKSFFIMGLLAGIQAVAVVIPTAVNHERPVMAANLTLVTATDADTGSYKLVLSRPATSRFATSFTFIEGQSGLRGGKCTGRCLPKGQLFRVVAVINDTDVNGCASTQYQAVAEEHVQITDETPDMTGHLATELTVLDHSQGFQPEHCRSQYNRGWEVTHTQYASGDETRHFEGIPEALLTIQ